MHKGLSIPWFVMAKKQTKNQERTQVIHSRELIFLKIMVHHTTENYIVSTNDGIEE